MTVEFCVIGGGIVGLATALELCRLRPAASVVVLEKEAGLAVHRTGHNSGVIHAGIYYKPGSLKADLCRRGVEATRAYCIRHGIPFATPGKLVVATNDAEMRRMKALEANAHQNGIAVEVLDAAKTCRRERNVSGLGALFVRDNSIVDYRRICAAMADGLRVAGGVIALNTLVDAIKEDAAGVTVRAGDRSWVASRLVVCGGLRSDRMARLAGLSINPQVIPFRGGYYLVRPERSGIVKHMIYPVPDPDLPFLGIHLTPMIGGALTVGLNAGLDMAREGYGRLAVDLGDMLTYPRLPGFWKVVKNNFRPGAAEMRNSSSKARYRRECQKYYPDLQESDLLPHKAGIHAQAVMRDGTLVHDFLFLNTERMLHVRNVPSAAATSAIPIGEMIARHCVGASNAPPSVVH